MVEATIRVDSALASHDGKYKCNDQHDNYHYLHIVSEEEEKAAAEAIDLQQQQQQTLQGRTMEHGEGTTTPKVICITVKQKRGDTPEEVDLMDTYSWEEGDESVFPVEDLNRAGSVEVFSPGEDSEGEEEEVGDEKDNDEDGDNENGALLANVEKSWSGNKSSGGDVAPIVRKGLIKTKILFNEDEDYDDSAAVELDEEENVTPAVGDDILIIDRNSAETPFLVDNNNNQDNVTKTVVSQDVAEKEDVRLGGIMATGGGGVKGRPMKGETTRKNDNREEEDSSKKESATWLWKGDGWRREDSDGRNDGTLLLMGASGGGGDGGSEGGSAKLLLGASNNNLTVLGSARNVIGNGDEKIVTGVVVIRENVADGGRVVVGPPDGDAVVFVGENFSRLQF